MLRRTLLQASACAGVLAAIAACTTAGMTTEQQVLADVQGLMPVMTDLLEAVVADAPNAIPAATMAKLQTLQAAAQTALTKFASLTDVTPGTDLQTIDTYLNAALNAIGAALPTAAAAFPALAPYVPMYDAAVALVENVIEPYLATLIAAPAVRVMHAVTLHYTPVQARAILKIK
jgi:hypothetical protein